MINHLNSALQSALDQPAIMERLRAEGVPNERFAATPQSFGAWIASEYALWGKVMRERSIKFD